MLDTGIYQQVDHLFFQFCGDKIALDALETVPRTNFNDIDLLLLHDHILQNSLNDALFFQFCQLALIQTQQTAVNLDIVLAQ